MTKSEQPRPLPLPLLLVYGKPTSPDLPQAAWFRIEDRQAVAAAVHVLNLAVIDIATEHDGTLLSGVHEGVLKGNGRMVVGSVAVDVYRRIEEHVRARAATAVSPLAVGDGDRPNSVTEQNKNHEGKGPEAAPGKTTASVEPKPDATPAPTAKSTKPIAEVAPDPWDTLRIGSHVVAKCWDEGEAAGWWIGKVTGFEKRDYVIVWLDDPKKTPPFKIERKHVAILHPTFDVKTEWDPRPTRR